MSQIPESPEDIPRLFVEGWNAREAGEIAALFTEDAEFVNVVGLWWHTREAIFKAHEYGLSRIFNNSQLTLRRTKVKFLLEKIAVVHARMKLTGQSEITDHKQPEDRYSIFTFVVQKGTDGWRCAAAHNTDVIRGAETNLTVGGKVKGVSYQ